MQQLSPNLYTPSRKTIIYVGLVGIMWGLVSLRPENRD